MNADYILHWQGTLANNQPDREAFNSSIKRYDSLYNNYFSTKPKLKDFVKITWLPVRILKQISTDTYSLEVSYCKDAAGKSKWSSVRINEFIPDSFLKILFDSNVKKLTLTHNGERDARLLRNINYSINDDTRQYVLEYMSGYDNLGEEIWNDVPDVLILSNQQNLLKLFPKC